MVRTPCCRAEGLKKGAWTQEEDQKLIAYVQLHGEGGWRTLPDQAGLKRCGKSCRLRWANYLRPDIKRGDISPEEEDSIINLHAIHGNKWSAIARRLPGRTDNEIKNHWNTHIKKRLVKKGIDPLTHKPFLDSAGKSSEKPETSPEENDQKKSNNKKSSGSPSVQFLNKVANRFGKRINHSVMSNIIGSGGLPTTNASECDKSTGSSSTPYSLLNNQNMILDAKSLSSSTVSYNSSPKDPLLMYNYIFDDIEDITRFSSSFLSHVDDDDSCLDNTLFMRELPMIFHEDNTKTTSFNAGHVKPINEVDDSSLKGLKTTNYEDDDDESLASESIRI